MKFTSEINDDVLDLVLEGDLIGEENGLSIMEVVQDCINKGIITAIVDISGLRYINSSGIGVLITLLTKFRNKGGEVVLLRPSENVRKLLIITKLNAIFTIVEEREEGVSELKNSRESS